VVNRVALPVTIGQASCQTLRLQFGAQDLGLPGQTVLLDQSILDVAPQPGTANQLCAAADAVSDPAALVNALNALHDAVAQ
jgi:hypothetical protein